jgi:membrane protease YdiL (CAAX protease family)
MLVRIAFLLVVGVVLPVLAIQSDRRLRSGEPFPPRRQIWFSVIITQLVILGIAMLTAWRAGFALLPAPALPAPGLAAAAGLLVLALALMPLGNRIVPRAHLQRLLKLGPRGRADFGWWLALSLTAGVVEEFVYRGVLTQVLIPMVGGSLAAAAVISAAAFAVTHMVQGPLGAAVIFVFALGFQWIVWLSNGELYAAMAAHALYDLGAGLYLAYVVRRRYPGLDPGEDEHGPPLPAPTPPLP